MRDQEPRSLGDQVINKQGDVLELADEKRMLLSAVMTGALTDCSGNTGSVLNENTHITVESLLDWLRSKNGYADLVRQLSKPIRPIAQKVATGAGKTLASQIPPQTIPVSRHTAQDAQILAQLQMRNIDPRNLPPNEAGKPGIKAEIKDALGNKGVWAGSTVFKKAWDRLLSASKAPM